MATSKIVPSPWNIAKRMRVQSPLACIPQCVASIHSSSPLHRADVKEPVSPEVIRALEQAQDSPQTKPSQKQTKREKEVFEPETPQERIKADIIKIAKERGVPLPPELHDPNSRGPEPRLPRSVQALYFAPLRRTPTHGIPVCNLQLRSYSIRNVEHVADFAMRAAYYLDLPAKGPVPLPRITERWTVPRSNFIFKKSQENWERVTSRRMIQIQDGHPEVVQRWLAFVRKWMWYGVGVKADVFEWEDVNVVKRMDENEEAVTTAIENVDWDMFGVREGFESEGKIMEQMKKQGFENTQART